MHNLQFIKLKNKILYHFSLVAFISCTASAEAYSQGSWIRDEAKITEAVDLYNLSGEGVVVVMIDRGIDYRHPDFIDDNGNTRIDYIFDLTDNSGAFDSDNTYGVGTIWDAAEINQALANNTTPPLTNDNGGHGTQTTGIMCGDGSGTASREFKGVAPNSRIISIKFIQDGFPAFGNNPGEPSFFDASLLSTAFNFATDKIQELGLPSVTLMNFGSIGGPTDGTSLICRQMDDYIDLGHPLVCGVGDDGGQDNRASGTISQGQTIELEVLKSSSFLRFDLWYDELDRFEVSVQRPDGSVAGPFSPPMSANDVSDNVEFDMFIGHRGANTDFFEATSLRRELLIDLSGVNGSYKVILTGMAINSSGEFIATLNPGFNFLNNRFLTFIAPGGSINDYSSSLKVISPTDYVVDNSWVDINGVPRQLSGQGDPGQLWLGSSEGPTQDGRLGTDFAAPGEVCAAAYGQGSYNATFTGNVLQNSNGLYGIQNAVSAAAPVSVGVIALMLEGNPDLTPEEVKQILQTTSNEDQFTQSVPNATWGYGKLNAQRAVEEAMRQSSDIVVSNESIEISDRTPTNRYILRGNFSNYNIEVLNSAGTTISDHSTTTENEIVINLSGVNNTQRFIQVSHQTNPDLFVVQRMD